MVLALHGKRIGGVDVDRACFELLEECGYRLTRITENGMLARHPEEV